MAQAAEHSGIRARLQEIEAADPLGKSGVRSVLLREGFDRVAVEKVLDETDWDAMALKAAREEIGQDEMAPVMVAAGLAARGFERPEIEAAVRGLDWSAFLERFAAVYAASAQAPATMRRRLRGLGFSNEQIEPVVAEYAEGTDERSRQAARKWLSRGVSRRQLQTALMGLGFTKPEARQIIREIAPDWNLQAVRAAEEAALTHASEAEVSNVLLEAGFTADETEWALDNVAVGSVDACERTITEYLEVEGMSAKDLEDIVAGMGYLPATAAYAMANLDVDALDWTETGGRAIARRLRERVERPQSLEFLTTSLEEYGYSKAQVQRGLELADPDWVENAVQDFLEINRSEPERMDSPRSVMRRVRELGYTQDEARQAARQMFHDRDEAQAALAEVRGDVWPRGRRRIEQMLSEAEYSDGIIADTMDNLFYDWNERALDALMQVFTEVRDQFGAPSPAWIRNVLEGRMFEPSEIDYAFEHADVDWSEAAVLYAGLQEELSGEDLMQALREAGFPDEAVAAALADAGSGQEPSR
ncbi:MAG: hypothetical protein HDQ87_01195 [Clostridia bacterium]|nr:hypothetical protein [Clostridia bacterium]